MLKQNFAPKMILNFLVVSFHPPTLEVMVKTNAQSIFMDYSSWKVGKRKMSKPSPHQSLKQFYVSTFYSW